MPDGLIEDSYEPVEVKCPHPHTGEMNISDMMKTRDNFYLTKKRDINKSHNVYKQIQEHIHAMKKRSFGCLL